MHLKIINPNSNKYLMYFWWRPGLVPWADLKNPTPPHRLKNPKTRLPPLQFQSENTPCGRFEKLSNNKKNGK